MGGADADPRRKQAAVRGNIGSAVAAQVQAAQSAAGGNSIGTADACHTRAGDEGGLRQLLHDCFCQHGFLLRVVKGFADDLAAGKNCWDILRREPYKLRFADQIRIDLPQLLRQGVCFWFTDVAETIVLLVEITELDPVIVGKDQAADAQPCQLDSNIRTKPAQPGDTDAGRLQALPALSAVPCDESGFKLLLGDRFRHCFNLRRQTGLLRQCRCLPAVLRQNRCG